MYALFKRLPRHIRQTLYDEYCTLPPGPGGLRGDWRNLEGQLCCPAGFVNWYFDPAAFLLPEAHQHLTRGFQVLAHPGDLERFTAAWDDGRVSRLATAMGVTGDY